jgi:hypothetical protein
MTKEDVYEYHYNTGKYHHDIKIKMELPSAATNAVGFRGYVDGYSGREFKAPCSPELIIDELHKNGMKTIN